MTHGVPIRAGGRGEGGEEGTDTGEDEGGGHGELGVGGVLIYSMEKKGRSISQRTSL